MPLYKNINGQLEKIRIDKFKLEKEIQEITENNLEEMLGLELVRSEFPLGQFRIDTLAFDRDSNAFVIIEYKRDKNYSVIDQGYSYLSLMLNNKADFILEYNENRSMPMKRSDVDWSQSRVIFISPSFTTYQREAINFKDLPIELWEIGRYQGNIISFTKIDTGKAIESIKSISKQNKTIKDVSDEIEVYDEESHLSQVNDEIKELYERYREALLSFDGMEIKPKKKYISFVKEKSNIVDFVLQKKAIKIFINLPKGKLEDLRGISRDVSNIGHWGNGDYEITVKDEKNFEYILSLIRQSYDAR